MNLKTYQHDVAIRTLNHDLGPQTQLANLTLGTVGEFAELKRLHVEPNAPEQDDIRDEGGDVLWYLANICNVLTLDLHEVFHSTVHSAYNGGYPELLIDEAAIYYGAMADIVKKTIAQGHVLDVESMVFHISELMGILSAIFAYYRLTFEEVCTYNHQKLLKRYPDGFEASRSINRG